MRKSLEERIVNFTVEFIKAVVRINEELIYEDYFMLFGKKKLMFEVIALDRMTAEDVMQELEDEQEMDVRQFADDEYCVAYMMSRGIYTKNCITIPRIRKIFLGMAMRQRNCIMLYIDLQENMICGLTGKAALSFFMIMYIRRSITY